MTHEEAAGPSWGSTACSATFNLHPTCCLPTSSAPSSTTHAPAISRRTTTTFATAWKHWRGRPVGSRLVRGGQGLAAIYAQIDQLEPSDIDVTRFVEPDVVEEDAVKFSLDRPAAPARRTGDVGFLLDVSRSMPADDAAPGRLAVAKRLIAELAAQMKQERVALMTFAGNSAVQCNKYVFLNFCLAPPICKMWGPVRYLSR
jgi:hypothetical protein